MLKYYNTVADLFGDLVNGYEVFFIQDAVSKSITEASKQHQKNTRIYFRTIVYSKWYFFMFHTEKT